MPSSKSPRVLAFVALAGGLCACGDAPSEPETLLVARETQAALQVSEALPTLPRLVARADSAASGTGPVLEDAVALWLDGRASLDDDGLALSEEAYGLAAPELARVLGPEELGVALRDLEEWIYLARSLVGMDDRLDLRATVEAGAALTRQAAELAESGDSTAAYQTLLRAADRLHATTPWAVSGRLIRSVEADLEKRGITHLDRNPAPADERAVTLARVQRLLDGAREARDGGDAALALQRAFYAGRLLDTLR